MTCCDILSSPNTSVLGYTVTTGAGPHPCGFSAKRQRLDNPYLAISTTSAIPSRTFVDGHYMSLISSYTPEPPYTSYSSPPTQYTEAVDITSSILNPILTSGPTSMSPALSPSPWLANPAPPSLHNTPPTDPRIGQPQAPISTLTSSNTSSSTGAVQACVSHCSAGDVAGQHDILLQGIVLDLATSALPLTACPDTNLAASIPVTAPRAAAVVTTATAAPAAAPAGAQAVRVVLRLWPLSRHLPHPSPPSPSSQAAAGGEEPIPAAALSAAGQQPPAVPQHLYPQGTVTGRAGSSATGRDGCLDGGVGIGCGSSEHGPHAGPLSHAGRVGPCERSRDGFGFGAATMVLPSLDSLLQDLAAATAAAAEAMDAAAAVTATAARIKAYDSAPSGIGSSPAELEAAAAAAAAAAIPRVDPDAFFEPDGSLLQGVVLQAACNLIRLTQARGGVTITLPWSTTANPASPLPSPSAASSTPPGRATAAAAVAVPLTIALRLLTSYAGAARALQLAESRWVAAAVMAAARTDNFIRAAQSGHDAGAKRRRPEAEAHDDACASAGMADATWDADATGEQWEGGEGQEDSACSSAPTGVGIAAVPTALAVAALAWPRHPQRQLRELQREQLREQEGGGGYHALRPLMRRGCQCAEVLLEEVKRTLLAAAGVDTGDDLP